MNLKQLGILMVLVIVLGGAGLALYRNQNASWQSASSAMGRKLLENLPVNDVSSITLAQGTNQLNLVKENESWRVRERHNYPADYSKLRDFLLKAQGLKAVQSERVPPAQLTLLHLGAPGQGTNAALAVEFKGKDGKSLNTLLLGKPHLKASGSSSPFGGDEAGWPDGRYVRLDGSDTVAVVSDPLENIEPKAESWLDKDFIRIDKAKSIEVDFPVTTNSWKLTRETESEEWKLAGAKPGEALDSAKASSLSYPLSSPSFADVLPGASLDESGSNRPTLVKIDTFDHFHYTLRIGQKTNQDYPLTVSVAAQLPQEREAGKEETPADKAKLDKEFNENRENLAEKLKKEQEYSGWTYLVSSWTIDPLLKERAELLAEKGEPDKDGKVAANAADLRPASPAGVTDLPELNIGDEGETETNVTPEPAE